MQSFSVFSCFLRGGNNPSARSLVFNIRILDLVILELNSYCCILAVSMDTVGRPLNTDLKFYFKASSVPNTRLISSDFGDSSFPLCGLRE
jgi:hypothetical protein